jgi:hypothetical protein
MWAFVVVCSYSIQSERVKFKEANSMTGTKQKQETARTSFAHDLTGLVTDVVNEAREVALKLGFEPGPDLCERVAEEDFWWEEQGIDAQSGESVGKGPQWARASCVYVLPSLLNPYESLALMSSAVDFEENAQSIEDKLALVRKYAPKAGRPPSPKAIAAFRDKRLAEQRMAELERQLAEARRQNTVA